MHFGSVEFWLKSLLTLGKRAARNIIGFPFISNANAVDESRFTKRALLVYLTKPFTIEVDDPIFLRHQNFKQATQIAQVLDELGYVVDVLHYLDLRFKPRRKYDMVISHRIDLGRLEHAIRPDTLKVYLAAGMNHVIHNEIIWRAYSELAGRRGCELRPPKFHSEHMPFVVRADALVGFGNEYTVGSWKNATNASIYAFNNYGFAPTRSSVLSKDFLTARKSFLFFASGSQVRKGLDLLLDVFPDFPQLHLYICSSYLMEPDFCKCYGKELFETPNVHPIGWVQVNSNQFDDLMRKCAFVIHPAREEGQPGSVVQCMYAGLIPLVSKESGIDTEEFGVTFTENSSAEIRRCVESFSSYSEDDLLTLSVRTRRVSEDKFSEARFCARWKEMIFAIDKLGVRDNDR
jgi:glycosyltransferase involved in cell wall biosynthesis